MSRREKPKRNHDPFSGHPCVVLDLGEPAELPTPDRLFAFGFTQGEHQRKTVAETPARLTVEGRFFEDNGTYLKVDGGEVLEGMSGCPVLNLRTGAVCGVTESRRAYEAVSSFHFLQSAI